MEKIKSVKLVNFQCHKLLELNFTGETNLISAGNLAGKTAIGRAIRWVMTDRPRGDWMRRIVNGKKTEKTSVKIVFEDSTVVTREKGEHGLNKYVFNGDEYENFKEMPAPVIEYFGSATLTLNKNEFLVPFTDDEESLFMTNENPSTRGALINYLTGIDVADKIKKTITSEIRQLNKDSEDVKEKITECTSTMDRLIGIYEIEQDFADVKVKQEELSRLTASVTAIQQAVVNLEAVKKRLEKLKPVASIAAMVTAVNNAIIYLQAISDYQKSISKVEKLKGVDVIAKLIEENRNRCEKLNLITVKISSLNNLLISMKSKRSEIEAIENELPMLNKEIETLKSSMKLVKCPTCGSIVASGVIKRG